MLQIALFRPMLESIVVSLYIYICRYRVLETASEASVVSEKWSNSFQNKSSFRTVVLQTRVASEIPLVSETSCPKYRSGTMVSVKTVIDHTLRSNLWNLPEALFLSGQGHSELEPRMGAIDMLFVQGALWALLRHSGIDVVFYSFERFAMLEFVVINSNGLAVSYRVETGRPAGRHAEALSGLERTPGRWVKIQFVFCADHRIKWPSNRPLP